LQQRLPANDVATLRRSKRLNRRKRGRHALAAAPAPDFRWLPFRTDAEGRAPAEINNIEDVVPERAMGAERPVIEVGRPKADGSMAVDVVAGAEVRLCAPRVVLFVRNPPQNAPEIAP
jgi:hypothetical protein